MTATVGGQISAGNGAARRALGIVADALTGQALDVRSPDWEDARILTITNARGVLCDVTLYADGRARFECLPCPGTFVSPAHTVAMVLGILGAGGREPDTVLPTPQRGLTFKGTVGRTLAGYGMDVALAVLHRDEVNYDICAEVEIANPAQPGRGRVSVADDGSLEWACTFGDPATARPGLSPGQIAEIVSQALVRHHT